MIETMLRAIARIFSLIGMIGMFAMMAHVTLDVLGKWLFNHPLPVTIEMTSNYYMVAVVFFPLAAVELRNGHISVELVSQHLRPRARRVLVGAGALVGAGYFALLTLRTWHDAVGKWEIGEYLYGTIALQVWQTRFFVPLGCGVLALALAWKAAMLFRGRQDLLAEGVETMDMDGAE